MIVSLLLYYKILYQHYYNIHIMLNMELKSFTRIYVINMMSVLALASHMTVIT